MATKKDVAIRVLALAWSIHNSDCDHEDTGSWLMQLLWIADDLNPSANRHPYYDKILFSERGTSKKAKLRSLIEHPGTGVHEREAAVKALARLTS